MTREEAIKKLREILTEAVEFENSVCYVTEEDREPLEMAIQALSQEPCDDAISREAVLEGLKGCICEEWIKTLFATMVKQLPPVTQKSGRWKVHRKYYECSSCGSQISNEFFVNYRFCPHCGARMESEE